MSILLYEYQKFTRATSPGEDLLHINDGQQFHIKNCVFEPSGAPDTYDECLGIVDSGDGLIEDTIFRGAGKACLINNAADTVVTFRNCVFTECSRRFPLVNSGMVIMEECIFAPWGRDESFYVKSGAVRARGANAYVHLKNCLFKQDSLWQCLTRKNAFKDFIHTLSWPYFGPGFARAAVAENGARILVENCKKNRWWLKLE